MHIDVIPSVSRVYQCSDSDIDLSLTIFSYDRYPEKGHMREQAP